MKKLFLLATCGLLLTDIANAQWTAEPLHSSNTRLLNQVANTPGGNFHKIVRPNTAASAVNKTTSGSSRWYNHGYAEASGNKVDDVTFNDGDHASLFAIWQDSTVRYPDDTTRGIFYLSAAQTFQPQADIFNDPSFAYNTGAMAILKKDAYTIDSVKVRGRYERRYSGYVDTLIFDVVYETATQSFVDLPGGSAISANHGIDTFSALLWRLSSFLTAPVTQIPYTTGTGKSLRDTMFRVPLNDVTFADSLADGTHEIGVGVGLPMLAGKKASVSITFKSGTNYTAGQTIDHYNYFAVLSHKTYPNDYTVYIPGDRNMSYMMTSDTDNSNLNATLGLYIPTIAYSSNSYPYELHDISWKATCNTCSPAGINSVPGAFTAVNAFPNPANTNITVTYSLQKAADVNVAIINTLGQVVKSVTNKTAANQRSNTTFATNDMANGVYFYTIETNGERVTRRFVVSH